MAWKKEYGENYYKNNREEVLERARAAYAANPDKDRDRRLRRQYGITMEDFRKMEADQGGCCKICGGPPNGKGLFHIDHDHQTGKIRGLLCATCNVGLGSFKDDKELLHKAITYLTQSSG